MLFWNEPYPALYFSWSASGSFGKVGLKAWRAELSTGGVGESTFGRIATLQDQFSATSDNLVLSAATAGLASRMSSGQAYFSSVLSMKERGAWEHTACEPTSMALWNLAHFAPFKFDKPNLGGDSWMVRRFAGLYVAGDEQGASIGLGFVPQFYIEAGRLGSYLGVFC